MNLEKRASSIFDIFAGRGGGLDELTEKQAKIYNAIKKYQENHGFPPTQEDLADNLNLGRSTIRDHLSALEKKGVISRNNSRHMIVAT
jgi:repressor LexA